MLNSVIASGHYFKINPRGPNVLSVKEAAEKMKIARATLTNLMLEGVVAPTGSQKIGSKRFYWFETGYIEEILAVMPKGRRQGATLVSDETADKMKAITAKWQKKAKG